MKRVYSLAMVLVLFGINAYSFSSLNVKGAIKYNHEAIENTTITIIKNGRPDTVITTNDKGKFEVNFKSNYDYNVIVSKEGFFTQNILFDTRLNSMDDYQWVYKFAMNLLPNKSNKPENFYLEPIALISYNEQIDEFENIYYFDDKAMFSEGINVYEKVQTFRYDYTIQQADSALLSHDFVLAKQLYNEAAILDESNEYADLQIDFIRRLETQERRAKEKCKKLVFNADAHFISNELEKAKKLYLKANKLNHCEHAGKMLRRIESLDTEDNITAR